MAGKPALNAPHIAGYRHGSLNGRHLLAHRVAWALHHGEWPPLVIDHKNGNPADNRITNLRSATQGQNCANRSGVAGVSFNKNTQKWVAYINQNRRMHHLGLFNCFGKALKARRAAAAVAFGEFQRVA